MRRALGGVKPDCGYGMNCLERDEVKRGLGFHTFFVQPPKLLERSEITMTYQDSENCLLDPSLDAQLVWKSIANNEEIDAIDADFAPKVEQALAALNKSAKQSWKEWEVPRE